MVYRLLPLLMVGAFEYLYMKKIEHNELDKKLAKMFLDYFEETRDFIQGNYDQVLPIFEKMLPIDRTMPILAKTIQGDEINLSINEEVEVPEEVILPTQKVEELIEEFKTETRNLVNLCQEVFGLGDQTGRIFVNLKTKQVYVCCFSVFELQP